MRNDAAGASRARRLCIVTPNHWRGTMGGAEYQIRCLLDTLIPTGRYEIYYVARHVAADHEPDAYRIVRIGEAARSPRLGYLADAVPLYRALRGIDPDVIYQRVGCGYTAVAAFYARSRGKSLIWHVAHDSDVMPRAPLGGRNPLRSVLEKKSVEYGLLRASRIVVQTENQARLLEMNYGRAADAVVRNFHPSPREQVDKTGPPTIVWVANLKSWKQPEVFVRLAMRLQDLAGARFVMIGALDRWRSRQAWNRRLLRDIAATPNLRYLGEKSQEEVNELLARAHIFVNTSAQEGFPNTFIQAWMRSVPVVSLNVNPDNVLNSEGVGVHAGSEDVLVETVRMLATDRTRLSEYAARACTYAMRHHSIHNAELLAQMIDDDTPVSAAAAVKNA